MNNATRTYYKYCIVPLCTNSSSNSTEKLFFSVPKDPVLRKVWTNAMKRDDKLNAPLSNKSSLWCCEDHFSLKDDMENYMEWIMTKNVKRLSLKQGRVPHIFKCQKRNVAAPIERKGAKKRKNLSLIQEAFSSSVASTSIASTSHLQDDEFLSSDVDKIAQNDKSCQVDIKKSFRSKKTNTDAIQIISVTCSPIKMFPNVEEYSLPENCLQGSCIGAGASNFKINIMEEDSESDYECPDKSTSDDEFVAPDNYKQHMITGTLLSIEKNPKLFLGLPPESFFLIKLITEQAPLPAKNLYVVLKKLRLNLPFSIMALDFGLCISSISRIFSKSLPVLAKLMQELIVWPNEREILAHLPVPFRARYAKVQSIIDCLEIEIERPSNPIHQALTWSSYYSCNTVKYLVSCTPDGVVSYISEGYGGRASDLTIVEDSGYLDKLSTGALVMADRGFKNIAGLLQQRGCSLIRPPSVSASTVCSKAEVKQSKRIAALRIHVERVIGRLRDFSMLIPHACVDIHLTPYLDYCIIIACGIINMQDHLIKKQT